MDWGWIVNNWPSLIFLGTLLVLGMPHGAIDHYLYFSARKRLITPKALMRFAGVYLLAAVVMTGFWLLFPGAAIWGLVLLTWFHWGDSDWIYEKNRGHKVPLVFGIWRGSLPMLVPLIGNSVAYLEVLATGVQVVNPEASLAGCELFQSGFFLPLLGVFLIILGIINWSLILRSPLMRKGSLRLLAEDLSLLLLFLLLPPLASVGLYFAFWHSSRHIRLSARIIGPPLEKEFKGVNWGRFYCMAFPFTAAGIILMVLLAWVILGLRGAVSTLLGSYLITLWALTWPHAWVVRKSL